MALGGDCFLSCPGRPARSLCSLALRCLRTKPPATRASGMIEKLNWTISIFINLFLDVYITYMLYLDFKAETVLTIFPLNTTWSFARTKHFT